MNQWNIQRADGSPGISYNVKKVFDVSQTSGKRPPAPTVNRDPKALITTMLDVSPVEVAATDELPYPNMAAFYNNEKQTLYVKRNVGDSVAVAQCVAQELGHAQLSINSESYSRRDMGFQAVCIGYMICKKYGVDTQNFAINRIPEGLASKEPKEIRAELSKTRNAMAEIHTRISDEMLPEEAGTKQRTMKDNGGQTMEKEEIYHIALDDYEHGIIIRSLNDEKTDLMNEGKSTDAVDDLIIKVGTAPKKKFRVIEKERSCESR